VPYLLLSGWLYRKLGRPEYRSIGHLLGSGIAFWPMFFLGLGLVTGGTLFVIMFRHAEQLQCGSARFYRRLISMKNLFDRLRNSVFH
jgi:hypothetical protein